MIVRGGGGDVNVRIEHFLYVTEEVAVADIFGVVCGVNPLELLLLELNNLMELGNT